MQDKLNPPVYFLLGVVLTICLIIPSASRSRQMLIPKSKPVFIGPGIFLFFGAEYLPVVKETRRYAARVELGQKNPAVAVKTLERPLWNPAATREAGLLALRFQGDVDPIPRGSAYLVGLTVETGGQTELRLEEYANAAVLSRHESISISVGGQINSLSQPQFSVAGEALVYQAGGAIWKKQLAPGSVAEPLFLHDDPNKVFSSPAFLVDEKSVAFLGRIGNRIKLYMVESESAVPVPLADMEYAPARGLSWPWNELLADVLTGFVNDPVTGGIVFAGPDGLYSIGTEPGAEPHQIIPANGRRIFAPAWSPDGKYLAYTVLFKDGQTQVFFRNRLGDEEQKVTSASRRGFCPVWSPDSRYLLWYEVTTSGTFGYYAFLVHGFDLQSETRFTVLVTDMDHILRADSLLARGQLKEAGSLYREHTGGDLANLGPDRLLQWALQLDQTGMLEEAMDIYDSYIESGSGGPGSRPYVLLRLANLSVDLDDLEAARGYYLDVFSLSLPRSAFAIALERALETLGPEEFQQLVMTFLENPAHSSADLGFLRKASDFLLMNGQAGEAAERILAASENFSSPEEQLQLVGEIVNLTRKAKQRRTVIAVLEQHRASPATGRTIALLALANLRLETGQISIAMKMFKQALESLEYPLPLVLAVVKVCQRFGEYRQALLFIDHVDMARAVSDTESYELLLIRGKLSISMGKDTEAVKHFNTLINNQPERIEAYQELIDHFLNSNRPDRALPILDRIPDHLRKLPLFVIRKVNTLVALEQLEEARDLLRLLLPRLNEKARTEYEPLMEFLETQVKER